VHYVAGRKQAELYLEMTNAILHAIARNEDGISFKELPQRVSELIPPEAKLKIGSIPWYTTTIKLDLETRGEIERIPGSKPQRLRRIHN
jgi:hypothetical protein